MAGNYVQKQIKRGSFLRHWCLVKWWTDKTAFRKWKVQGNIQGAASFSPIRNNTVCLTAICLFQLAVLRGRTLNPHHSNYVSLFFLSPLPRSVRPSSDLPPWPSSLSSAASLFLLSHSASYPMFFSSSHHLFFFKSHSPPPFSIHQIRDKANEGGLLIQHSGSLTVYTSG